MAGILLPGSARGSTGDIDGVTAGDGLSGGGTSGSVTLNLDLSGLSDVTPANGDKLATIDSDGANEQLTTVASLATLFAGTGLTASSSVIGVDASQAITALTGGDLTIYEDANNADVSLKLGTSATESLTIEVLNGSSNKTAEEVHFSTATASGTANHGKMVFDVDGTDILTIDDSGLTLGSTAFVNTSGVIQVASQTNINAVGTIGTGVWQGTAIASAYIAGDAITGAKIADDAIDSEHYTDGSIDTAHLAADAVTGAKIADDAINSEHYTDGSIDTAHIADNQVTAAKIADIARGSILYGNASAATAELTKGSANTVLTSDGTDISWAAAGGGGLVEYDIWSLSSDGSDTTEAALDTNLIRWAPSIDSENAFEKIGTGMTKSSGNFTFPSTGKYEVIAQASYSGQSGGNDQVYAKIHHTVNSTSATVVRGAAYRQGSSETSVMAGPVLLDIRDTSDTVQFEIESHDAYGGVVKGNATILYTFIAFKKIGDT